MNIEEQRIEIPTPRTKEVFDKHCHIFSFADSDKAYSDAITLCNKLERELTAAKKDYTDADNEVTRLDDVVTRLKQLLGDVLTCGLNEGPPGSGYTSTRQERKALALQIEIEKEL